MTVNNKPRQHLISILDACADQLAYLNKAYPHLSTEHTHTAVENWRERKIEIRKMLIEFQQEQEMEAVIDLEEVCSKLLEEHSLEDVSDILLEKYGMDINVKRLIKTIGKQEYIKAMRKEASFLRGQGISNEQIADLWNELDRPGPNMLPWSEGNVQLLGG